jgi:putative hemolysin
MKLFKLNKLNRMYNEAYDDDSIVFCDNCLKIGNNKIQVSEVDLNCIPETGPLIFMINHPHGALDALVLMKTLLARRPDTMFIANFLLSRVKPAAPHLIEVNPFETRKEVFSSYAGFKEMFKHLQAGGAISILPAGEVSTKYGKSKLVEDRDWQPNVIKLIRHVNAPVVSGFISGKNSRFFHFAGKIHPTLRTALLPIELLNKKNNVVTFRFTPPKHPKYIKAITDDKTLANVLKARTYCLDNVSDKCIHQTDSANYKPILKAGDADLLKQEVAKIKNTDLLFATENYQCFFSKYDDIPNVFMELSRLREMTFREVGEGTGNEKDTDKFDSYYHHLFIWDDSASAVVGAYRIGMGEEIIKNFGINGFYLNSLFKFKDSFTQYLDKSMEMGRSFIVPDYQRKPLPLFLLWKGIYVVTQRFPQYKYLIGPASISSLYSNNAKILLIEYLKRHHGWPELSEMVGNRIPFNYKLNHHHEALLSNFGEDLSAIDRIIKDIDTNHFGVPILIKKYLSLGGRILDFNVDPDFNYAIDGLVVLDIAVVSEEVIKSYNKI